MPVTIERITRKIMYKGTELVDMNPNASVHEVVAMHADTNPALLNAVIEGPVKVKGDDVYTVNTKIATKG